MSKQYSVAEARSGLATLLKEVEASPHPVEITRHGKPVAVVLSLAEYQRLKAAEAPGFAAAYAVFCRETPMEYRVTDEDPFEDVRDRSEGRDVKL